MSIRAFLGVVEETLNKDRFHNLHLFAGKIEEEPDKNGENTLFVRGSLTSPRCLGDGINGELEKMPNGRTLYVEAGLYYIGETIWHLPSDTNIYLEGGAVLIGGLVMENGENIHISGRGIMYMADFARFSSINGIRFSHCKNITVEDLMFINPPHYTISLGGCEDVTLRNIKSFSCEGWSDGIDMMSCRNVTVEGGFLRTSDDCVAIYGGRWDNHGNSENISVSGIVLWADVAHPLMIGTHGDHMTEGNVIQNITFENIDILEHHEFQPNYLGAMTINAGDKNTVRNILYKNIRIEPFEHGKVLDIQVKWNKDYNPAPGRGIQDVLFEGIYVTTGSGEETSVIEGYSEEFNVHDIIRLPRKLIQSLKIDNTANQIKAQTMTLSTVTIGKFHNLKDLDFCVNIFYQNTLARNTVVLSLFVISQLAALWFLLRRFAVLMK